MEQKNYVDEALAIALARVQLAQSRIHALLYALEGIPEHERKGVDAATDKLYGALVGQENEAYRKLFMLAHLGTDQDRLRAAELALERYLSDSTAIMSLLRIHNGPTYGWFAEEEKRFREDIAARAELVRRNADNSAVP